MCSKKVPLASEGGSPDFINTVSHINMKSSTFVVDLVQIYTTVFINKVTCFCRYIKVVCHKSSYFQSKDCCTPFCRMFQFFSRRLSLQFQLLTLHQIRTKARHQRKIVCLPIHTLLCRIQVIGDHMQIIAI